MDAPDLSTLVPAAVLRRHRLVPLAVTGTVVEVGAAVPPAPAVLRDLAFLTGRAVVPVPVPPAEVDAFLAAHTPPGDAPGDAPGAVTVGPPGAGPGLPVTTAAGVRPADGTPAGSIVQIVDGLLRNAVEQGASDVHVEPYEHLFRVRYRLDGVLHPVASLSLLQRDAILARLKIMASLDIAEKRRPQDGRIRFRVGERTVDVRVSTLPTDFGEKVVLRILDRHHLRLDLEALGLRGRALADFRRAIRLPYGMILVTGPTGSGKTTTLYAALDALNAPGVNITTIEDPIEYNLPGVNQTHVRADIGFTFARALRAFLRQDPNVIMVGEIRDAETAEVAVRAALTGHLVLSTLHTNDAPSTVMRLVDMGVEPFLVASSVRLVLAQRLVRRICLHCRAEHATDAALPAGRLWRGRGCVRCGGTGYRGRLALFEVMPVDEPLAALVAQRAGLDALRRQALAAGMRTLRDEALERVDDGVTPLEEALRETGI